MKALIVSTNVQVRTSLRGILMQRISGIAFEMASSFDFASSKLKNSEYKLLIVHVENKDELDDFLSEPRNRIPSIVSLLDTMRPEWHPQLLKLGVSTVLQEVIPNWLMQGNDPKDAAQQDRFVEVLVSSCKRWTEVQNPMGGQTANLLGALPDHRLKSTIDNGGAEHVRRENPIRKGDLQVVSLGSLLRKLQPDKYSCIVIASSTGGPEALTRFFRQITHTLSHPIFIVQHMPAGFTEQLAGTLSGVGKCKFAEARVGVLPAAGNGVIAPGDWHMRLRRNTGILEIYLTQTELVNSVRPAADLLFEDAVACFSLPPFALVFTGMGEDGCRGAAQVVAEGGVVLTQVESSCAVYGMPRAVDEANLSMGTGTPEELGQFINQFFADKTQVK